MLLEFCVTIMNIENTYHPVFLNPNQRQFLENDKRHREKLSQFNEGFNFKFYHIVLN